MLFRCLIVLACSLLYTSAINCDSHYHQFYFEYDLNFTDRFNLSLGSFLDSTTDTHKGKLLYNFSLANAMDNSSIVVLYHWTPNHKFKTPPESLTGTAYPCRVPPCTKWIDFDDVFNPSTLLTFAIDSEGPTTGHLVLDVSYCKTNLNEGPSMSQIIRGLTEGYWISWLLAIFILVSIRGLVEFTNRRIPQ
jgi:hypothetical protein